MRRAAFRDWLDAKYVPDGASSRLSEASRVEAAYGDLDRHFSDDRLESLIDALSYSAADEIAGTENPTHIAINGNIRNGLASLRAALRCYQQFASERTVVQEG